MTTEIKMNVDNLGIVKLLLSSRSVQVIGFSTPQSEMRVALSKSKKAHFLIYTEYIVQVRKESCK